MGVQDPARGAATDAASPAPIGLAATEEIAATVHRVAGRASSTLEPEAPSSRETEAVLQRLRRLLQSGTEGFAVGRTLGEGGMGFVREAKQRSVGRTVAVKSLHDESRATHKELRLLREAWLTASLEHPNIVPVYDVVLDPDQGPLIVLKKVEGVTWTEILEEPSLLQERAGYDDLLSFSVETAMQVCRALHFAHSKGVIHRDIKPDNVMIGSFGEVYLLDWGIAAAMTPDREGRLPTIGVEGEVVGTPSFMAPEMVLGEAPSVQTDVYLVGAALACAVTGEAPHRGAHPNAVVTSILRSEPTFPAVVPEPLQAILRRAMRPSPTERYPSVEALRLELAQFLRNREALRLIDDAEERLDELRQALEAGATSSERIYQSYGACLFATREALRRWPGNDRAEAARAGLVEAMVNHLLGARDPSAAAAILAEHPGTHPKLEARVDAALEEERRRRHELERIARDNDPAVERTSRRAAMVAMGVVWVFAPLSANLVDPTEVPRVVNLASPAVLLVLGVLVFWRARRQLSETAINRRFIVTMFVGFCAHMVHILVTHLMGLPPRSEIPMGMVTFGALCAMLAHTAERGLWPFAFIYWFGALVGSLLRVNSAYVLSLCNFALTLYMFVIWAPRQASPPGAAEGR